MLDLCAGLKERGVMWRGWTRADLSARRGEERILEAMADSGCQALCIGVEAGSDRVLAALDKRTTVAVNSEALRRVHAAGMQTRCSIMVGCPGETWEDVLALVDFIAGHSDYIDDWILSAYVPLPGSPSWEHPERYGLIIDKEAAKLSGYAHYYVVGGAEESPYVHRYEDGTGPEEIALRHRFVQESLLRLCPRDRVGVTIGRIDGAEEAA